MNVLKRSFSRGSVVLTVGLAFMLAGCVPDNADSPGAGGPGSTGTGLVIALQGPANLTLTPGQCQPLQVSLEDQLGNAVTASSDTSIALSAAAPANAETEANKAAAAAIQFFEDPQCTEGLASAAIPAQESSLTFYISGSALGSVLIIPQDDLAAITDLSVTIANSQVSTGSGSSSRSACIATGIAGPQGEMITSLSININTGDVGPFNIQIPTLGIVSTDARTYLVSEPIPSNVLATNGIVYTDLSSNISGICTLNVLDPIPGECPQGFILENGLGCVAPTPGAPTIPVSTPVCPAGFTSSNGVCLPPGGQLCPTGYTYVSGIGCEFTGTGSTGGSTSSPSEPATSPIVCTLNSVTSPAVGPVSGHVDQPLSFTLTSPQNPSLEIVVANTGEINVSQLPFVLPSSGQFAITWSAPGTYPLLVVGQSLQGDPCTGVIPLTVIITP